MQVTQAPSPTPTTVASTGSSSLETGAAASGNQLAAARDVLQRLTEAVKARVIGRDEVIDLTVIALIADGHVLLEDFPGSGKTTLAKALGETIVDDQEDSTEIPIAAFRRIQFTPDLLPSDVTGSAIFDVSSNNFHFRHGPIFAHVVLADEINRTSPKVQSAMLEAMGEKQVTVDNVTYPLDPLFFVIATQNPLDLIGTYPLPTPQLDRFLFKISMQHIERAAELEVLQTWQQRRDLNEPQRQVGRNEILAARRVIDNQVYIADSIKTALVDTARALRADERVIQGNSTRSLVLALPALQVLATLRGRSYVNADDLETLLHPILGHRVELAPGVADFNRVLRDCLREPMEALARSTLKAPR